MKTSDIKDWSVYNGLIVLEFWIWHPKVNFQGATFESIKIFETKKKSIAVNNLRFFDSCKSWPWYKKNIDIDSYIDVGGFWGRNVLVTGLSRWWHVWYFMSLKSPISKVSGTIILKISLALKFCHQNKVLTRMSYRVKSKSWAHIVWQVQNLNGNVYSASDFVKYYLD